MKPKRPKPKRRYKLHPATRILKIAAALQKPTNGIQVAHACRLKNGTIAVRVLRKVTKGASGDAMGIHETRQSKAGSWDYLTQDNET